MSQVVALELHLDMLLHNLLGQSSWNGRGDGASTSDELGFTRLRQPPLPVPLARRRVRRGGRHRLHGNNLPEVGRLDQSGIAVSDSHINLSMPCPSDPVLTQDPIYFFVAS